MSSPTASVALAAYAMLPSEPEKPFQPLGAAPLLAPTGLLSSEAASKLNVSTLRFFAYKQLLAMHSDIIKRMIIFDHAVRGYNGSEYTQIVTGAFPEIEAQQDPSRVASAEVQISREGQ